MDREKNSGGPKVVVLGGPNGSGKSTSASRILQGTLGVEEFVNADVIAQGLSGFSPDKVGMAAGRVMLQRLKALAQQRTSFGFETTLASRSFAPWLRELIRSGYSFHLVFLWLPSAEMAVARVAERVRMGGHDVPEPTVRRRYHSGLRNFFRLYMPLAKSWQVMDNSVVGHPEFVASGQGQAVDRIGAETTWNRMRQAAGVS